MFARVAKQIVTGVRRFSNESETQLETWIKINDRMHIEAAAKAESAVSGVKAELSVVKSDVAALRYELKEVKADVSKLAIGQVEIHKEINKLHAQSSNQTRLILAGGAAIASAFFAANQYVEHLRHKDTAPTAGK